jgi:hypothetical protein
MLYEERELQLRRRCDDLSSSVSELQVRRNVRVEVAILPFSDATYLVIQIKLEEVESVKVEAQRSLEEMAARAEEERTTAKARYAQLEVRRYMFPPSSPPFTCNRPRSTNYRATSPSCSTSFLRPNSISPKSP